MKQFLIIGNQNAITYKEIFPYIKDGTITLGYNTPNDFIQPDGDEIITINGIAKWFTTLDVFKPHLQLTEHYDPERYPKYDNYDAIEVSKTKDIPCDYDGVMGVPVSFLMFHCPSQFEIVKFRKGNDDKDLSVNGRKVYFRILIRPNSPVA